MDRCLLKQTKTTRSVSKRNLTSNLGRVLVEAAGGTLTVRGVVRDGLSAVLRRAREGAPRAIGGGRRGGVVISVRDLATPIDAVMEPTLSEVLERSGSNLAAANASLSVSDATTRR